MSADGTREFVDANVLIYALDSTAGVKKQAAEDLLARLWSSGTGCLSVQVLQEFVAISTRKLPTPLTTDEVVERVSEWAAWEVFSPTANDVIGAIRLHSEANIGFWDAMVVRAASETGCTTLWTEDLNDGQVIAGVQIRDPFGPINPGRPRS